MNIALKYKPNSVMYLIDLGYYYSVIGDVNKGIELTKKALKHDSENIRALNQLGIYYMAKKDEEKAYKFFHLALKYAPNNETTFRNLAKGYYVFGRYDKALNYSKQRINNNMATIHRACGASSLNPIAMAIIQNNPKPKINIPSSVPLKCVFLSCMTCFAMSDISSSA